MTGGASETIYKRHSLPRPQLGVWLGEATVVQTSTHPSFWRSQRSNAQWYSNVTIGARVRALFPDSTCRDEEFPMNNTFEILFKLCYLPQHRNSSAATYIAKESVPLSLSVWTFSCLKQGFSAVTLGLLGWVVLSDPLGIHSAPEGSFPDPQEGPKVQVSESSPHPGMTGNWWLIAPASLSLNQGNSERCSSLSPSVPQ